MSLTAGVRPDANRGPAWSTQTIIGVRGRTFQVAAATASTAWPVANTAFALPFLVSAPITFAEMFWFSGTTPGTANIDLGIYREDFTLLDSIGATAAVNTTDIIQPVGGKALSKGPLTLTRGRYYMAMSAAAVTITTRAQVQANGWVRALGMQKMATAHPLPATFIPASMGTTAFIPWIGMTTITNLL